MAPRRNAVPRQRIDLELYGVAAIGLAIFLGIAMVTPPHRAGAIGAFVRWPLVSLFGSFAAGFPIALGLSGAVCFLELGEAGVILTLSLAFFAYLILLATGYAAGAIGGALNSLVTAVFGDLTNGVLWLLTGMLTVLVTGVSIKRLIGRTVVTLKRWQANLPELRSLRLYPDHRNDEPRSASRPRQNAKRIVTETTTAELPAILRAPPFPTDEDEELSTSQRPEPPGARPTVRSDAYAPPRREAPAALSGVVIEAAPIPDARRVSAVHEEMIWPADESEIEGRTVSGDAPRRRIYRLPDLSIFDAPTAQKADESNRKALLEDTLASFGVGAKVIHIERGPSITRYELKPERGVKISRISSLADDLALALAATSVRIEAPIPGKSAVGIEVPNAVVSIVSIREILEALPMRGSIPPLAMALGKDITGQPVYGDLGRMPHLLVAGATGAGKSVCLNSIIASLLATATPDQVQMLMIDPKRVELTVYNGIPHLVKDVITDARLAAGALFEMTKEMDSRYERFAKASVRKIEEYNAKFPDEPLPYVVIVIDELADLMLIAPAKVETTICRLAQLARATGIHLVVATQRPSVDVITGIIKANIPSRIAFAVSSQVDSRTILDMAGAERLLGRGDIRFHRLPAHLRAGPPAEVPYLDNGQTVMPY